MPKGTNQKFKLYRLAQIMQENTDDSHYMTMPEIMVELKKYGITAERKSISGGKDRKILSVPCCKSPFWTCRTETSGRCNSVIEIYYREKKQCTD